MKEKIKYIIIFIAGIIISTVTSVYAATVITAGEVSYTSNSNTTVQTGLNNLYTKANTMANDVTTLKTSKQNVLKSVTGTAIFSNGYTTINLGSNKNVIACSGYITSNATIPVICGVQSGQYLRFTAAYNTATLSLGLTYTYWYYD